MVLALETQLHGLFSNAGTPKMVMFSFALCLKQHKQPKTGTLNIPQSACGTVESFWNSPGNGAYAFKSCDCDCDFRCGATGTWTKQRRLFVQGSAPTPQQPRRPSQHGCQSPLAYYLHAFPESYCSVPPFNPHPSEPFPRSCSGPLGAYLGRDPVAFSCVGKKTRSRGSVCPSWRFHEGGFETHIGTHLVVSPAAMNV